MHTNTYLGQKVAFFMIKNTVEAAKGLAALRTDGAMPVGGRNDLRQAITFPNQYRSALRAPAISR